MADEKSGTLKIINQFLQELQRHLFVKRIILFGSYAKSQQDKWSDIDLAVISDGFKDVPYLDRLFMLGKFAWQAKTTVIEALGFTEEEYNHTSKLDFLNEIKKNGV
ncbi:nucleotidyltransferase domain-containing protein, partial [bacterium]|nr:nucleotidyltransferase domain-containing protein [bacterium]MBU1616022.1 nucleotidyltransferase domain-containing protein [bacterium]